MANERLHRLRGLQVGGTPVGGLQRMKFKPSFANVVMSAPNGAVGPQTVDLSAMQLAFNFASTDWTKAVTLMTYTGGAMTFALVESGAVTEHEVTAAGAVFTGLGLTFPRHGDAVMALDGEFRDPDTQTTFATLLEAYLDRLEAQPADRTGFPDTFSTEGYRPNNVEFLESTGTEGNNEITIPHVESVNMSVKAQVNRDNSDDDIGFTAVDIPAWDLWDVSLKFRAGGLYDTTTHAAAAEGNVLAARLISAIDGELTFNVHGRAGGAPNAKSVSLKGVKWIDYDEDLSQEFAVYTLIGKAQWRTTSDFSGAPANPLDLDWVTAAGPPAFTAILAIG